MIYKFIIAILIVVILFLLLFFPSKHTTEYKEVIITDTVYVDKIKIIEVPVEVKATPNKLKIQRTQNKAIRDTLIKNDIIIGVRVDNSTVRLQSVDTTGVVKEAEYSVKPNSEIVIDSNTNVEIKEDKKAIRREKRKKTLRKIGTIVVAAGAFILGALL